jgi:hypothetical protein
MHDQPPFTSLHFTPSNDLGEDILDRVGGREHLSLRIASITWNPWGFPRNASINFGL